MAITSPKVPKPSDPQMLKRSQSSAREAWRMFEIIAEFVTATERPRSRKELLGISGVGQSKLERYGDAFLDIILSHDE